MFTGLCCLQDNLRLGGRGHSNVQHFYASIAQQIVKIVVDALDREGLSQRLCMSLGSARNGNGIETRFAIGRQMAIAHDETGPDGADPPILALGPARANSREAKE